ncbi:cytochrome b [Neptunicella marina]|nr:cytochrome b [Neptunicella marina]
MAQSNLQHYTKPLIIIHWLTLLLFIAVYCSIEFRGLFERGTDARTWMVKSHFIFGCIIWLLVWIRLFVRRAQTAPAIIPAIPDWQHKLAGLFHLSLYGLMLAMPVLGYSIVSLEGKQVDLLLFDLPNVLSANTELAHDLEEIHELIGKLGYALIGVHAVAALFHHYMQRDNTLSRMLPRIKPRS